MSDEVPIATDPDRTPAVPGPTGEVRVIGHYRLLRLLGEGGMGEVWEAEQTEPVQRRVALKLIKRGMDSGQVIARFESERQALALMDHPAIAKVFDAGTTERGRPYFVMELVHGVPITEYCDRHRLTLRERLQLFIQVCEGIHHAHQKAVIHRDVKPSNILITDQDGRPVPKIIDFGVAKATSQRLTERTLFTELGQLVGTPEYMSPEQADLTGEDIDIRTDVYSLGMVLYELLVGDLPFGSQELREAGLAELQRKIREDEPVKPSTRVTRMGKTSTLAARYRRTTPGALVKSLRGDLDWIVLMALEKDRNHRYGTAQALKDDLERALDHRAIEAHSPGAVHRISKFVRRHRLGVAAGAAVFVALLSGLLLAVLGMVQARRAESKAQQDAATANEVTQFLVDTFRLSDPEATLGATVTARELLDRGIAQLDNLDDQPAVQARLLDTMAEVYINLALYEEARDLLDRAIGIKRELEPVESAELADSVHDLGGVEWRLGDIEAAHESWTEALRIRRRIFGPVHRDIAQSVNALAVYQWQVENFSEAGDLFQQSLDIYREAGGEEDEFVADRLGNLALIRLELGDYEAARRLFEEGLAIKRRILEPNHPNIAWSLNNLGQVLRKAGDYEAAERVLEECVDIEMEVLGPENPRLAYILTALGTLRYELGQYEASEELHRQALAVREGALGTDHFEVAYSLNHLGMILNATGRFKEARSVLDRALRILEENFVPDHSEVGYVLTNLGISLVHLGDLQAAGPLLERALAIHEENLGSEHIELAWALEGLATLHEATEDFDRAVPLRERSLSIRQTQLGDDHPFVGQSSTHLGILLTKMGNFERADELLTRALDIEEAKLGTDHPETVKTRAALAALSGIR
jgi:non-specific serine/threonine protein kinase/serine/threonine-protein kinase